MTAFTLEQWLFIARDDPVLELKFRLQSAETVEQIRACVENGVEIAINELVKNRQHKQNKSEDELTVEIASLLSMLGIKATHDTAYGGHTDLCVELRLGFLWLGEAKIWTGSSWAFKGVRQLVTRYSTGMPNQNHGGIILYFYNEKAGDLMGKWKDNLSKLTNLTKSSEDINDVSFRSTHNHPSVGRDYTIRHFGIPLFWKPNDG